jgi:hypothetical protein
MGNPLKGEAILKAGDETIVLSYSVEALYRLEEATEMKIGTIKTVLQDEEQFSMKMLRSLLWAGMIDSKGIEFTLDDVGSIISKVRPKEALDAVTVAFVGAFAEASPGGAATPTPPRGPGQKKSGTGSDS